MFFVLSVNLRKEKIMFNRVIIAAIAALTITTSAYAETIVHVNRMAKYASSEPLLYKIAELLPKYAEKEGAEVIVLCGKIEEEISGLINEIIKSK